MVNNTEISSVLEDKMMEYSAYVILHRAIPSLNDGLKPSLRRILYTMKKENMTKLTKSANVSGSVMKIHPHSDCYPTIVGMVQEDNHLQPFVIGKGSFAQHTSRDLQPASSRYSEVRIAPYSLDMMKSLEKNIVDMTPTFDGSSVEPVELPVRHPNILTHSQQGMAVGMSSNIPSFNLNEVCLATIEYIATGKKTVLTPDFSTYGYIIEDKEALEAINSTGKGSFKLRGKMVVEGNYILVKEIPYNTTREAIMDKVIELVKKGKLKDIVDVKDTTGLNGMEIEFKIKKNTDTQALIQKLYELTPLESTFVVNMNVLHNNKPIVCGTYEIIDKWVTWRRACIKRVLEFDIEALSKKLHILKGLEKCLNNTDKVIDIIKNTKEEDIVQTLSETFTIDTLQAEEVSNMKLRDINKDKILKKINEIRNMENTVVQYQQMCSSVEALNNCIISGLKDVMSNYGKERKTVIIQPQIETKTLASIKEEDIESYSCQIVLTKEYIKKNKKYSENQKLKEGDEVLAILNVDNADELIFVTNQGRSFSRKADTIALCSPSEMGNYQRTLFNLKEGETIISVINSKTSSKCLFITKEGKALVLDTELLLGARIKQAIKVVSAKFNDNVVIYCNTIADTQAKVSIQTIKKPSIELDFDIELFKGTLNNTGRFLYNCRSKKDELVKVL